MKEALIAKGPTVQIVDSPVPEPQDGQVLIKVIVSGSNPKDWKVPEVFDTVINQGDDIAGVVVKVGGNVTEFKPGDRVAAFHEMMSPHGSYAEYSLAWSHTTFHIPEKTSFEEAAAIPLAAMTAAVGLYLRLGLPEPWLPPPQEPTPLIVYGAASAVGAYALQLAAKSEIHPLICVAGGSSSFVESLIDRTKGDTIVDYRDGDEAVVTGLKTAANGRPLLHAFDAVSEKGSYQNLSRILAPGAKVTFVLPGKTYDGIPDTIQQSVTQVGCVHKESRDFGYVHFRYIARGLQEGWFKAQKHEIVPGGLAGIQPALEKLKAGYAHAVKYVFRIEQTDGAGQS